MNDVTRNETANDNPEGSEPVDDLEAVLGCLDSIADSLERIAGTLETFLRVATASATQPARVQQPTRPMRGG